MQFMLEGQFSAARSIVAFVASKAAKLQATKPGARNGPTEAQCKEALTQQWWTFLDQAKDSVLPALGATDPAGTRTALTPLQLFGAHVIDTALTGDERLLGLSLDSAMETAFVAGASTPPQLGESLAITQMRAAMNGFAAELARIAPNVHRARSGSGAGSQTRRAQPHPQPQHNDSREPCRDFRRGKCRYGASCQFSHRL